MKTLLSLFLMCVSTLLLHAQATVTGKVVDEAGQPIAGVSIGIKGTGGGVLTNTAGLYAIHVPGKEVTLIFSCLGYETQQLKIKEKTVLNVTLVATKQALQEVVVTGFETQRKKSFTGSVVSAAAPGVLVRSYNLSAKDEFNREGYDNIKENSFQRVTDHPLSTFSIDVDAASYSNVRRLINEGTLPPPGAVRVEEMINYFSYNYPQPVDDKPFSVCTESVKCPWNKEHELVMIGLQGKKINYDKLPASNLVFLIDVSGSMEMENKLPLVKSSLNLLTDQLRPQDKIAIVVYAGNAGLVLPSTNDKGKIRQAVNSLEAGGSTAGGAGIVLAYKTAEENFMQKGNNRVILCTDGDFNVGASSDDALENLIEKQRASGVYLTVLGFGDGNYQDAKMQKLADKGNGNHAYIDNVTEARKVLVSEFGGTLFTVAKDVKLQVEFNPEKVSDYRLVGYENRMLAKEDFNNDKKDAGDMGSNHTVTALYEVIPVGAAEEDDLATVDPLRYQKQKPQKSSPAFTDELMFIKLRYKQPGGDSSSLMQVSVSDKHTVATNNIRFAAAVAAFGMVLRNSEFKGGCNYRLIKSLVKSSVDDNSDPYRKEFVELVKKAETLNTTAKNDDDDL